MSVGNFRKVCTRNFLTKYQDVYLAAGIKAKQQWLKNIKVDFSLMRGLSVQADMEAPQ